MSVTIEPVDEENSTETEETTGDSASTVPEFSREDSEELAKKATSEETSTETEETTESDVEDEEDDDGSLLATVGLLLVLGFLYILSLGGQNQNEPQSPAYV